MSHHLAKWIQWTLSIGLSRINVAGSACPNLATPGTRRCPIRGVPTCDLLPRMMHGELNMFRDRDVLISHTKTAVTLAAL